MSLTEGEITRLREGKFTLEALELCLTRSGDRGDVYRGPGSVRQTPEGKLEFTIYDVERKGEFLSRLMSLGTGVLIPEGEYHELEGRDWRGRSWRGGRSLPRTDGSYGEAGVVCRGELHEVTCSGETSLGDHKWLFFPGDFRIPTNEGTRVTETSPIRESHRFDPNIWGIKGERCELTISNTPEGIEVIVVHPGGPLPGMFVDRLEEAIWFTLAVPAKWRLLEEHEAGRYRFTIRDDRGNLAKPRVKPALNPEHGTPAVHLGRVLDRYLSYVLPYEEQRYHPTSVNVLQLLRASAISLNAEALALSVAIESLVRREFSHLGRPPAEWLTALDSATEYISRWGGDEGAKERINKAISGWKGPNPREALKQLAARGVITEQQLTAWNTLRHRTAHGQEINRRVDELAHLCDLAYMGWMRIMFEVIAYEGPYVDRSTPGWPMAEYSLQSGA